MIAVVGSVVVLLMMVLAWGGGDVRGKVASGSVLLLGIEVAVELGVSVAAIAWGLISLRSVMMLGELLPVCVAMRRGKTRGNELREAAMNEIVVAAVH